MSDLGESPGLSEIDQIAEILDHALPKEISYVLLKCGTLVMISPESVSLVLPGEEGSIFPEIGADEWDYPEHRFNIPEDLRQVVRKNKEYLSRFLEGRSREEKIYFQLALRYLRGCRYAYPGGERSDRNVDTPLPVEALVKTYGLDPDRYEGLREFAFCSWPACPGLFNHFMTKVDDPKLTLASASTILSDLHRYDYIWPRFHCMRMGVMSDGGGESPLDELD